MRGTAADARRRRDHDLDVGDVNKVTPHGEVNKENSLTHDISSHDAGAANNLGFATSQAFSPYQHAVGRLDEYIASTLGGIKTDTAKPPYKSLQLPPDTTSLVTTLRNEEVAQRKALLSAQKGSEVNEVLQRYGSQWALLSECMGELGLPNDGSPNPIHRGAIRVQARDG